MSNTRDEKTVDLTAQNSVFFEINTVDKHITLSTPENDGEKCRFVIQLNYGDANFSLSDTIGNSIVMDSVAELIQMRNASDSFLKLDKSEIVGEASEAIKFKTKLFDVQTETFNVDSTNVEYNSGSLTHNGKNVGESHAHSGVKGGPDDSGPVK